MAKEAAITVRVPRELKRKLEARARRDRRSVSAQVVHELEQAVTEDLEERAYRPALGMFPAGPIPTEEDFCEVRAALWGRLAQRNGYSVLTVLSASTALLGR